MLDKLFENKKATLIIPIGIALVMYLLFVLIGMAENKVNLIITIPIVSFVWFLGVYLVVFLQIKNPICPERFLDLFELLSIIVFTFFTIVGIISWLISGFKSFNIEIVLGCVTYSAISLAHSKRIK